MQFLKEPLLHFLLLGVLLFGLFAWFNPSQNQRTIVVERENLANFLQYRLKAFDENLFQTHFEEKSNAEKQAIIDAFVREEALYREAQALGLEENDYIIKQRLIKKLEYIAEGISQESLRVSEQELQSYFKEHKQNYIQPGFISFSHIYFKGIDEGVKAKAKKLLVELTESKQSANETLGLGDLFPYNRNYVEKTQAYITGHFGENFAENIVQLGVEENQWQGPFQSDKGWHLIQVFERRGSVLPELEQIQNLVLDDVKQEQRRKLIEQELAKIIANYSVEVKL